MYVRRYDNVWVTDIKQIFCVCLFTCFITPYTFQLCAGHLAPNVYSLYNFMSLYTHVLSSFPMTSFLTFFHFFILTSIFLLGVLLSVPHLKPSVAALQIICMFNSVLSCRKNTVVVKAIWYIIVIIWFQIVWNFSEYLWIFPYILLHRL